MTTTIVSARASALRERTRPTALFFCLGIVFVVAATFQAWLSVDVVRRLDLSVPYFSLGPGSARIDVVTPEAESAGLRVGERLIAVNGRRYTGTAVLAQEQAKAVPGTALALTVRDPGKGTERTIEVPVTRTQGKWGERAVPILLVLVMPVICLVLGCWVVLVRPRDRLAWLLLAMLLSFTQLIVGSPRSVEARPAGIREFGVAYSVALGQAWPIFMFLFGFYFPEPFPAGHRVRRWSKLGWWLVIAPLTVSVLLGVIVSVGQITNYSAVWPIQRATAPFDGVVTVLAYAAISGFFCFIFMKSSSGSSLPMDARRRLRLLYWGTTLAMTPALVVVLIATFGRTPFELLPTWITYPALLMMLLFPLTLAYVIVVQRAMDVRVVLRQSLQYGLAKSGIRALQFVAIGIVIAVAFALAGNSNFVGRMAVIAVAITVGFSIPRMGERLRVWTDRRFFREAYNADQVLSELSDQVRSMVETHTLVETVATRIADTLHIPNVAVLLGAGPYRPAYAVGFATPLDVVFPSSAGPVKLLQRQKEPARVYFDDPDSWLYREPEVSEEDRGKLAQLQTELLLPLNARDKLLGFISLGPKRSDEPYSGSDLRLLKSVAAQTGLALENSRLMSAIADEVAQRERLNREVEIAREVQERLFPQTLPPILGIDYAGACRPALGVGGDYYDFLALPGGQLGIAIGDVSGKGIAAALTMASLQASLRGEATRMTDDLAALVSNVNRLVYEASSANRYATFFYGQYNPASRQLTYVNAGHNPPMLFHCSAGEWQLSRLETGGTVVGLLESFPYVQATVTIRPGDIFIAFTDGISEAMNVADEEWGEERMIATIRSCSGLSPSEAISHLMQAADAFVAGAKQHDDMTLVVLQAKAENASS